MQNIFTLHILGTRIPTPYFCIGQESESESVSVPESESSNVIKPYYCRKFCLPVDKSGFTLDDCCAIYFMYLQTLIMVTYTVFRAFLNMARNDLILCQVGQTFQERFVIVKKTSKTCCLFGLKAHLIFI